MKKINLNLNGKNLGFHFGLGFMGELKVSLNCDIEDIEKVITDNFLKAIPRLMHAAYTHNCEREGKEVEYSLYDLMDLIDEDGGMESKAIPLFMKAFTDSRTKDVPKEPLKRVGKKKAVLQK